MAGAEVNNELNEGSARPDSLIPPSLFSFFANCLAAA